MDLSLQLQVEEQDLEEFPEVTEDLSHLQTKKKEEKEETLTKEIRKPPKPLRHKKPQQLIRYPVS